VAEGLDMFRLGAIATGGRMIPSGNLSFTKTTMVGWMLELNPEQTRLHKTSILTINPNGK
jgi:hypothetical protein